MSKEQEPFIGPDPDQCQFRPARMFRAEGSFFQIEVDSTGRWHISVADGLQERGLELVQLSELVSTLVGLLMLERNER